MHSPGWIFDFEKNWRILGEYDTYAIRTFATPYFVTSATPLFVTSATPIFRTIATRTYATPKIYFGFVHIIFNFEYKKIRLEVVMVVVVEEVVDKEMTKVVEEVNRELVK